MSRPPLVQCGLCRALTHYAMRVGEDRVIVCGRCLDALDRTRDLRVQERDDAPTPGSGLPDPGALT